MILDLVIKIILLFSKIYGYPLHKSLNAQSEKNLNGKINIFGECQPKQN